MSHYAEVCNRCKGRPVAIRTRDGQVHRGIVDRVNNSHVFLRPLPSRNLGGYSYGFWGPRPGFGWGVALGTILGVSLLPLFFW
ncbi:hypothetical protein [Radiobacillus sp. PE A8.2]|uniref:hypothetical protein n=1 Tax=Radiobacillus sp. PE A8.2 TaxID=3380349 RepID=UPI00388EAA28